MTFPLSIALTLALLLPAGRQAAAPAKGTLAPLFNGTDLSGWTPAPGWKVQDGALVHLDAGRSLIATERELGDVQIEGEFQLEQGGEAIVLLRSAGLLTLKVQSGTWHTVAITQVGERATAILQGTTVLQHARVPNIKTDGAPLPATGPLTLGAIGGVRWRKLSVRPVDAEEARTILAGRDETGFVPIFNGRNFDGWAGPIENYQVVDGTIVCKPDAGGTIYTSREYSDFVARLEIKLPPGGNNGLAIRYPGEGDPAYAGMTELQVLDNTAAKYARLDPRQFHGSMYGMVAAHKGFLRPVGEWNFEEVTVRGSRITVELNGTQILDGDVSKVTAFLDNRPHPGKDRTSGHFGFAGHGDPVQYRNVRIKPL